LPAAPLVLIRTAVSTEAEWERHKRLRARAVQVHAAAHPEAPEAETLWKRAPQRCEAFEHRGRDTLGFGLYVFQKK
jgi:hypothetical protein